MQITPLLASRTLSPTPPSTPVPSGPAMAAPGDRLTFSGEAKDAVRRTLLMPKLRDKETQIAALLNETIFADINGLTVLKALEEDLNQYKDSDGDVSTEGFIKRLGASEEEAVSRDIRSFLKGAERCGLTYTTSNYVRLTELGYWISQDPQTQAMFSRKKGLL